MKAFLKWRCGKCLRGGHSNSAQACPSCGAPRPGPFSKATGSQEGKNEKGQDTILGASANPVQESSSFVGSGNKRPLSCDSDSSAGKSANISGLGSSSMNKRSCGSLGAAMQKSKAGGNNGQPFRNQYKTARLPEPWKAAHGGSVIFRKYCPPLLPGESGATNPGPNLSSGSSMSAKGPLAVAAFDFDNTLVSNDFSHNSSSRSVEQNLMFPEMKSILSGVHALGYRIVIFSNHYLGRLKNPDPIAKSIKTKTERVDNFCQLMGIPAEIYLATEKDRFRKASSKDIHDGKTTGITAASSALWEFMVSDPTEIGHGAPVLKDSFYVGDAAGRERDKGGDADFNFAKAVGVRFLTEIEFFSAGGQGQRMLGQKVAPVKSVQQQANEAGDALSRLRASVGSATALASGAPPLLVILSGLPGSGKSTAARAVLAALPEGVAVRISQDLLKTAQKVEKAVQDALASAKDGGPRIIFVDRTNATAEKRTTLVQLARELGASSLVFSIAPSEVECKARCISRSDHDDPKFPTDPRAIGMIIGRIRNSAQNGQELVPTASEGMDAMAIVEGIQSRNAVLTVLANHVASHFDQKPATASTIAPEQVAEPPGPAAAAAAISVPAPVNQLALPLYNFPSDPIPQSGNFRDALGFYCSASPSKAFQPFIFARSSELCVIYDAYPKAKMHLLAMFLGASMTKVNELEELSPEHLPALESARSWVFECLIPHLQAGSKLEIRAGFHAIPSLNRLHLHVISQDFDSPRLKNKKHWVSFTHPDYFIELDRVIELLRSSAWTPRTMPELKERAGNITQELKCHRCGLVCKNMPTLKSHISQCVPQV